MTHAARYAISNCQITSTTRIDCRVAAFPASTATSVRPSSSDGAYTSA